MKLVLMRHAEAADLTTDGERYLTEKGHNDAKNMGRVLKNCNWQWLEVRTSPLLRARQTADHVASGLGMTAKVDSLLKPDVIIQKFKESLGSLDHSSALLCVFHMPDVAILAAHFLEIDDSRFYIPPGSAIGLNLASRGSCLQVFHYQPDFLTNLSTIVS